MFTPNITRVRRGATLAVAGVLLMASLAGCARLTSVDTQAQVGSYKVDVQIDPKTLNPPQYGTLSFGVTDVAKGKPVTTFESLYGALLHSVLISRDMQHFWHSYTQDLSGDRAGVPVYFPVVGKYYDYALFKPAGDKPQVFTSTVTTGEVQGEEPSLVEEPSPVKTQGWLTFELVKGQGAIKHGQPTQLVFNVRERGYPVTALWPYLGSAGQLWVVDSAGGSFGHEAGSAESHSYGMTPGPGATGTPSAEQGGVGQAGGVTGAAGTALAGDSGNNQPNQSTGGTGAGGFGSGATSSGEGTPGETSTPQPPPTYASDIANALSKIAVATPQYMAPAQRTAQASLLSTPEILPGTGYGPNIAFTHTFPHAGMYKCWMEVQYRGQVITVEYVVKVE